MLLGRKNDVGSFTQDQHAAAKRRGGRSQAESRIDGVQRVSPVVFAEWRAGVNHSLARELMGAARGEGEFFGLWSAEDLQNHRGGLWGP